MTSISKAGTSHTVFAWFLFLAERGKQREERSCLLVYSIMQFEWCQESFEWQPALCKLLLSLLFQHYLLLKWMLSCFSYTICTLVYFRSQQCTTWECNLLGDVFALRVKLHMATTFISYHKCLCVCVLCKMAFHIKTTDLTLCVYAINKASLI